MANNIQLDPEKRSILYIKESLAMLTKASKKKFENIEEELLSIEALINQMKEEIPDGLKETVEKLEDKVTNIQRDIKDMQNTRKREVKIYMERFEKIDNQLEHQKEAIGKIMSALSDNNPKVVTKIIEGGEKDD